jgi:serine/threonine protein kinase
MALSPGDKLGPYEILAPIGAGGMGAVYRALDTRLNRDVAVKVSTEKFNDRFEREAKAIAALNHPNICQIYDVGPDYIVMEYVDGAPIVSKDQGRLISIRRFRLSCRDRFPCSPTSGGQPSINCSRRKNSHRPSGSIKIS